jgi:hypothetical protein
MRRCVLMLAIAYALAAGWLPVAAAGVWSSQDVQHAHLPGAHHAAQQSGEPLHTAHHETDQKRDGDPDSKPACLGAAACPACAGWTTVLPRLLCAVTAPPLQLFAYAELASADWLPPEPPPRS